MEVKEQLFRMKILYREYYYQNRKQTKPSDTLTNWIFDWLRQQKKIVKPNTYINYKSKLMNHVVPKIGHIKLAILGTETLQKFMDELHENLASSSVNSVYRVLNTCLNTAVAENLLLSNPLNHVQAAKQQAKKVSAFSREEQIRLEKSVIFKQDFPIIFALYTGVRIGELVGMRWEDIDWENHVLSIERNIQPTFISAESEKIKLGETSLKTSSSQRVIPIGDKIFHSLEKWFQTSDSFYVFSNKKGDPIAQRTLRYRFYRLKRQAKVPDLPFHALRHTFATRCIENEVPITTVSSLLGHQSVKMTLDVYTSSFISEKWQAIHKLEENYNSK